MRGTTPGRSTDATVTHYQDRPRRSAADDARTNTHAILGELCEDWRGVPEMAADASERIGRKIHGPNAMKIVWDAVADGLAEVREIHRPTGGRGYEFREIPWGDE